MHTDSQTQLPITSICYIIMIALFSTCFRCIVMVGLPYPNLKSPELKEKMEYLNTHMVSVTCSASHSKLACSTVALFIHVMFGISMLSYWPCFIMNFKFRMMIAIILLLHQYWGRKGEEGRKGGGEEGEGSGELEGELKPEGKYIIVEYVRNM